MSHRQRWLILFLLRNICTLKGQLMLEATTVGANSLHSHPRAGVCKEIIELFVSQDIGTYCRFVQQDGWFNIEPSTPEKLFSWNHVHGGYFKRFSTDLATWRNRDYEDFCRILRSPELFTEICSDNIRIYKHRDHSV